MIRWEGGVTFIWLVGGGLFNLKIRELILRCLLREKGRNRAVSLGERL